MLQEKFRQFVEECAEKAGLIVVLLIAGFLYGLVGTVLAFPYAFLAGGAPEDKASLPFFLPAGVLVAVILWFIRRVAPKECYPVGSIILYSFTIYIFLPVLLNFASYMLALTHYETTAKFVFEYRYTSIAFVPIAIVVIFSVYIAYEHAKIWIRAKLHNEKIDDDKPDATT